MYGKKGASIKERHFTLNMKIYMYVWGKIFFSYDDFWIFHSLLNIFCFGVMCLNLTLRGWVFILIKQTGWDQHVILEYTDVWDMDNWLKAKNYTLYFVYNTTCVLIYIMRGNNMACWHVEIGTWWRGLQLLSVERFCQVLQTTWTWTPVNTPVPWSLPETAETWPFCVRCINSELTGKACHCLS